MSSYLAECNMVATRMCNIVKKLSEIYNFNYKESLEFLSLQDNNISDNSHKLVNSDIKTKNHIPLPFCGYINEKLCKGIKLNHGLYTQCCS